MEDFIDNSNPFCIQIVKGYIVQTTPSDSESCLDPDWFGNCFICDNHSEYSDYTIQTQIKYRVYVNSK